MLHAFIIGAPAPFHSLYALTPPGYEWGMGGYIDRVTFFGENSPFLQGLLFTTIKVYSTLRYWPTGSIVGPLPL